jgi:hypothetical protein
MREFKIRASSAGKIMTDPRSKSETLSETCKTYCQNWVRENLYDRRKEFVSKHTDKGLAVEDQAIDYAAFVLNWGLPTKNQDVFTDAELLGTPDLVLPDFIVDIKCSWDCFTFPLFDTAVPNKDYYWQMQTYMALTDKPAAVLAYILMDAPEHLIEREARFASFNAGLTEIDMDLYDQVKAKMTYSNMPDALRVKTFRIERNEADITALRNRVLVCREYIASLHIPVKTELTA